MPFSIEEQKDLEALHALMKDERENFSLSLRLYIEMGPEELKHSGHKTNEAAVFYAAKAHVKRMDVLVKTHLRKWPDK
jgi:hypothetical protein